MRYKIVHEVHSEIGLDETFLNTEQKTQSIGYDRQQSTINITSRRVK